MADSVEKLRARKLDVQERAFLCDLSRKIAFQATLVREKLDQNPVPRDRRSFFNTIGRFLPVCAVQWRAGTRGAETGQERTFQLSI